MKLLALLLATLVAFFSFQPSLSAKPIKFGTLDVNYAPDSALVINEGDTQMFKAPLCKGKMLDGWSFKAKVYLMNVPWDSAEVGDDTWLHIRVSNSAAMTAIVADNVRDAPSGLDPSPFATQFTYNSATWGSDDIYIEITAARGSPTYQYGLELSGHQPVEGQVYPDGMDLAVTVPEHPTKGCGIETLEQVAVPYNDHLTAGQTGQYMIPFCFDSELDQRSLTVSTLVPEAVNEAPGGVASFLCSSSMLHNNICYRATVTHRGKQFFDPSGAKVNAVTPTIPSAEYGPLYLLVLAQGNYQDQVEFTISTKLKNPPKDLLQLTGHQGKDMQNIMSYLRNSAENAPLPLDTDFLPREEL